MNIISKLRALGVEFLDMLFPQECVGCGMRKTWLCQTCITRIPQSFSDQCWVCKKPALFALTHAECRNSSALTAVVVAHEHHRVLHEAIALLKYQSVQIIAHECAKMLVDKLDRSPMIASLLLSDETIIIPVPMHAVKQWTRGYNQTLLIAEELAKHGHAKLDPNIVVKARKTKPQAHLNRKKRLTNLKGAFKITRNIPLYGKTIVVVDDITTTGTTLNELARVLIAAGAKEVWALAVMRG